MVVPFCLSYEPSEAYTRFRVNHVAIRIYAHIWTAERVGQLNDILYRVPIVQCQTPGKDGLI